MARTPLTRALKSPENTSLPTWWILLGGVTLGLFFLFAAVDAIRPDAPASPYTGGGIPIVTPTTPTTTEPSGTVTLAGPSGSIQVPSKAVSAARRAAAALFTGDFSAVTVIGDPSGLVGRVFPSPVVSDPARAVPVEGGFRVLVPVDPDGRGPEPVRELGVVVVDRGGTWAFQAR